jgi:syntaxin 6
MLDELQDDLQNAEEQLGLVMGKLAKMLKTKNKCHLGTIVILSIIVIVLFFLVIYT